MHRRDVFKLLIGAGAVGAAVVQANPPSVERYPTIDQPEILHGYGLHWSGLIPSVENSYLVGQWLAWPTQETRRAIEDPPFFYVIVPGFCGGVYYPGYSFNISGRGRFVLSDTPHKQIHAWIREGEGYLIQMVSEYHYLKPDLHGRAPLYEFPVKTSEFFAEWKRG